MERNNLEMLTLELEKEIENLKTLLADVLKLIEQARFLTDELEFQIEKIYNLLYALESELREYKQF
jgi:transcriptional accessory protein Tex/SPT6